MLGVVEFAQVKQSLLLDRVGSVLNIFDDTPIAMFFAVIFSLGRAQKHTASMMPQVRGSGARGWVFTTSIFTVLDGGKPRFS